MSGDPNEVRRYEAMLQKVHMNHARDVAINQSHLNPTNASTGQPCSSSYMDQTSKGPEETDYEYRRRYETMMQRHNTNFTSSHEMEQPRPMNAGASDMVDNTLTAQRFYGNTIPCSAASSYAPSEMSFAFKPPSNTDKHTEWLRLETRVTSFLQGFRHCDMDKSFLKMWVRASLEIFHLSQQTAFPKDEVAQFHLVMEKLKAKYYGGVARPMSAASNSHYDPFGSVSSLTSVGSLRDNNQISSVNASIPMITHPQQDVRDRYLATQKTVTVNLENLSMANLNRGPSTSAFQPLDNLTTLEQPSSNIMAPPPKVGRSRSRGRGRPSGRGSGRGSARGSSSTKENTVPQPTTNNRTQGTNKISQNDSVSSKGVSRFGRQIKSPHQFWKGLEKSILTGPTEIDLSKLRTTPENSTPTQDLNETITLRSSKTYLRDTPTVKKTARGKPPQTLQPISESNHEEPVRKKTSSGKSQEKENKEKTQVDKRKTQQKENKDETQPKKERATKKATPKEKRETKKAEPVLAKKQPTKRKKIDSDLTITKRKKIEESSAADQDSLDSDVDDLFEPLFAKKKLNKNGKQLQVLSPSLGLQSVKKAAVLSQSKETPPAKLFGELVETDFAPRSSVKEAPGPAVAQVVNRITKKVEKAASMLAKKKPASQKPTIDIEKSKLLGPNGDMLTIFKNTEIESDDDDDALSDNDNYDDLF